MARVLCRLAFAAYALLIAYLSLRPMVGEIPGNWDKLYHLLAYGGFALLGYGVLREGRHYAWVCLAVVAYGALMEYAQSFVPGRMMSLGDLAANTAGVAIAAFLVSRAAARFAPAQGRAIH